MELAQSMLYNSTDPSLVLVASKSVLAKVNVTSSQPAQSKPTGRLRIENAGDGSMVEVAMVEPSGALPTTVPSTPSLSTAYTATVPANLVKPGLRLTAILSSGQVTTLTVSPRVGGGVPITVVALPLQIGSSVAGPIPSFESGMNARFPVSNLTQQTRSPYVSQRLTAMPSSQAAGRDGLLVLLDEITALRLLENAGSRTYYLAVLPDSYLTSNSGVSTIGGTTAIVQKTLQSFVHELGHGLSLLHAPCGTSVALDPNYPYPNGLMGSASKAVWGFNRDTQTFVNPLTNFDVMTYCGQDNFSDYSHGLIQAHLTPSDRVARKASAAPFEGPQPLLVVSGNISQGRVTLSPLKQLMGEPTASDEGNYLLRMVTSKGVVEHRFETKEVTHLAETQAFGFTVPHPGSTITSVSIVKGDAVLLTRQAGDIGLNKTTPSPRWTNANPVLVSERSGTLKVTWNHELYPYLTATHVGASRTVLAQDLTGGSALLKLPDLPRGGQLEFSLSDGLNTLRWTEQR
jgi:hypothetical protein